MNVLMMSLGQFCLVLKKKLVGIDQCPTNVLKSIGWIIASFGMFHGCRKFNIGRLPT
jgi:hypothetical protein